MSEHKYIWLQPECCADPDEGRHWCQDPDPVECDDGKLWTKYILASEYESLERQLADVRQSLQRAEARRKAEVTANMVGGIQVEDGDKYAGADNLAIVLVSYFERHMDRPEPDPDGENGWGEWAEAKARKAMQIIADEINKAREPLPASDGGGE